MTQTKHGKKPAPKPSIKNTAKEERIASAEAKDVAASEGYELIKRLKHALNESGENAEDAFLQRLDISRQYWNQFCNGTRPIQTLIRNPERRKFLAQFLGCSQLEIRIHANDITPDELVAEEIDALWLEMEKMRRDPRWGMLAPTDVDEWDALPIKYRILIVSMYRMLTDEDLQKAYKQGPKPKKTVEAL